MVSTVRRSEPESAFPLHAKMPDGRQTYCRDCFADIYRARRESEGHVVKPAQVPAGFKFCRGCQQVLPLGDWAKRTRSADGYHFRCRECVSRKDRADHLARSYGLTPDDLAEMLSNQNGLCAICLTAEAAHVDHDHTSGRIRGVLCFRCNAALGQFDDQPANLRRAAVYLEGDRPSRSRIDLAWQRRLVGEGLARRPDHPRSRVAVDR